MLKERWWLCRATCPCASPKLIRINSRFCVTGGKRLLGRCVQWWFHLCFEWRPCLWPVNFLIWQQHRLHIPTVKASLLLQQNYNSFCFVYVIWSIFFKEPASTQGRELMLISLLVLTKLSFETQVSLNIASCFQIVISCAVWAHSLPNSYFHLDWPCVCVEVGTRGVKLREVKLSELCLHRGFQNCPRATGVPPPSPQGTKLLPHLCGLTSSEFEISSVSSCLLTDLWNVLCRKTQQQNIILRITHSQFKKCTPFVNSSKIKPCFVLFLLSELLASPVACKAQRSCF